MNKKIIVIILIIIFIVIVGTGLVYNFIIKDKESSNINAINKIDLNKTEETTITENENNVNVDKAETNISNRKTAYYDKNGFVTDSLYIDVQIYCKHDEDNIKAIVDSRIDEIIDRIKSEMPNTSGIVVINLSGNTKVNEKVNVLFYTETYRRYKMLKTYFDNTFFPEIMKESNKPDNSNIFNVDLEKNKNISYDNEENTICYSIKTGTKIENVSDLFSSDYDYAGEIKERVKYMLDLNIGHSESEIINKVNEAYSKLNIDIDFENEKLKFSLGADGFEMFFNEFDKSQMTIY